MKKIFNGLLLAVIAVLLSGCSFFENKVKANYGQIHLTLDAEFKEHFLSLPEPFPEFTFEFPGALNTLANIRRPFYTLFAGNDDFVLSSELAKLFAQFKAAGQLEVEIVAKKEAKTARINRRPEGGKVVKESLPTDDGFAYYEVAYIALANGLKLTFDYRRFLSGGITYYVWRESSSISMTLYYPLMVVPSTAGHRLVLLTLPNRVKYQVGPLLRLKRLLKGDEYLKPGHYTLKYPDDLSREDVLDYYKDYNLRIAADQISFDYLGHRFGLKFLENNFFALEYLEKL